jgi:hypothetical protein
LIMTMSMKSWRLGLRRRLQVSDVTSLAVLIWYYCI